MRKFSEAEVEKLLIRTNMTVCEKCNGQMVHVYEGKYECRQCGHVVWDGLDKVRTFLEENEEASIEEVSKETGVHTSVIEMFLQKGNEEIQKEEQKEMHCERCGCSIHYGNFCSDCMKELASDIRIAFNENRRVRIEPVQNLKKADKMWSR